MKSRTKVGTAVIAVGVLCLVRLQAQSGIANPEFHHIHLNVVDPAASAAFYTKTFETTTPDALAGWTAIRSDNLLLLFNKMAAPPSTALDTAIWHVGWASPDIPSFVRKALASGLVLPRQGTGLARVKAPDGNTIEINSDTSISCRTPQRSRTCTCSVRRRDAPRRGTSGCWAQLLSRDRITKRRWVPLSRPAFHPNRQIAACPSANRARRAELITRMHY